MDPVVDLLLNKLPPSDLGKNVHWFGNRIPKQEQSVVVIENKNQRLHQQQHYLPFCVMNISSQDGERPFLICACNDAGSGQYRSPWTNRLYRWNKNERDSNDVPFADVASDASNEKSREIEIEFNKVWDAYKSLYYGAESVGSVYLSNSDGDTSNLEGCFCIQKICSDDGASWNSISFVRAEEVSECEYEYTVDTTIHTVITPIIAPNSEAHGDTSGTNNFAIGTTMSKLLCKTCKVQPDKGEIHKSHIEHIGTIIEANETELRSNLERNVIPKHQETIVAIQKKQARRPQVNPLMGMMMNSDMLKKRLAKSNTES
jgi:F-actin capping protein, beta subunit